MMSRKLFSINLLLILSGELCRAQVLQFGECAEVETMQYFDLEKFLGEWYEVERFPTWYEQYGNCAMKRLQYCARRIEIEHIFVRDGIQFVLHLNSTYAPGDDAIFVIQENNIDPVGIPLSVISTDYANYAVIYGCKTNEELDIKYLLAWILSRTPSLSDDILKKAYQELNSIPFASVAYLEKVDHSDKQCYHYWTAHVDAENVTDATRAQILTEYGVYGFI